MKCSLSYIFCKVGVREQIKLMYYINLIRFNEEGKVIEMSFGGNTHELVTAYGDTL